MIASDIHGSSFYTQKMLEAYRSEKAERLLLLGDILLTGHTHIPACIRHENYTYMNPGSVSLPKNESWHGYMLLENGKFVWKDLEGNVKLTFSLADELSK